MKLLTAMMFLVTAISVSQTTGATPFLPLNHWIYPYLDLLKNRGHLNSLFYSVKPYTREEITNAIQSADVERMSTTERRWVEMILKSVHAPSVQEDMGLLLKASADVGLADKSNRARGAGGIFPEIGVTSSHFAGSLRGRIDTELRNDSVYTGRKTKHFGARVEEAYGLFRVGLATVYFGRTYNHWSPFSDESLILSSKAYSYDQVGLILKTKQLRFHAFHAQLLNQFGANRYVAAHRLDVRLPANIQLGFTETVIYGGPDRQVDMAYLNPFTVFTSIQLNELKEANSFVAFDAIFPYRSQALKLQVLVDDFILDGASAPPPNRKTSSDRLGCILGYQVSDFILSSSLAEFEYSAIGSYTYNVKSVRPWQSYTQDSKGLGAPGNDHDRWLIRYRYFPIPRFVFEAQLTFVRQGERSLMSNDFVDSTFVKLPFPSGTVMRTVGFEIGVSHLATHNWNSSFVAGLEHFTNYNHDLGRSRIRPHFHLRTEYTFESWTLFSP